MEKRKALIIGASRGLGLALAKEFLARNWSVTGTVRQESGTALHETEMGGPTLPTQLRKPSHAL